MAKAETTKFSLVHYDQEQLQEKQLATIDESFHYKDTLPVTWINIDGLHEIDTIDKIGHHFHVGHFLDFIGYEMPMDANNP